MVRMNEEYAIVQSTQGLSTFLNVDMTDHDRPDLWALVESPMHPLLMEDRSGAKGILSPVQSMQAHHEIDPRQGHAEESQPAGPFLNDPDLIKLETGHFLRESDFDLGALFGTNNNAEGLNFVDESFQIIDFPAFPSLFTSNIIPDETPRPLPQSSHPGLSFSPALSSYSRSDIFSSPSSLNHTGIFSPENAVCQHPSAFQARASSLEDAYSGQGEISKSRSRENASVGYLDLTSPTTPPGHEPADLETLREGLVKYGNGEGVQDMVVLLQHINALRRSNGSRRQQTSATPILDTQFARFIRKEHLEPGEPGKTTLLYFCCFCPHNLQNRTQMVQHVTGKHFRYFRHKCTECSREFCRSADLKKHTKEKHSDQKITCSSCGRVYSNRRNLLRHLKTPMSRCAISRISGTTDT
ncbi:hypothetical protein CPB86DRAFT_326394 [Serendipita vermifera]|nr:hypothetical protein CPB86DRAFT_326394 [Serendipita vermifera]